VQPVRDFDAITSDLAIWHAYDLKVKAELYSTCLATGAGTYLVDPIPLQPEAFDEMMGSSSVAGIVLTNSNHRRAAAQFAQRSSVPIFARPGTFPNDQTSRMKSVSDGDEICDGLRVIAIDGGPLGEIALHYAVNGGTLIVGDALINFEPYAFTFLPAKYCSNQKQMRRSLRKLLDHKAKRILFAHGAPILSAASERLLALLNSRNN
jgi:glyoxylase-like metal-dependent hydrolase (beta-lactamase superfamily II)